MTVLPEVAQAAFLALKCESLEKEVRLLTARNAELRESNAWFRARNIELLRLLSGNRRHPGDPDPHGLGAERPPICCDQPMYREGDIWQCGREECRNYQPTSESRKPTASSPFIRDSRAHL